MIPYPSDRMILISEYDRGYAAGQQDILDKIKTILSKHNDRDACRELACLVLREGGADV